MAEKAFDAFSQRRDTGSKARVTDRKAVDTDPNRYRLPPTRRVRVYADQLDMTVSPEKSKILSLAEGLNKVKPDLMNTFTQQAIDANMEQVDLGTQAAQAATPGELNKLEDKVDNEWYKYGVRGQTSLLEAERLSTKLALDMEHRPRDITYNEAYDAWWQENQPTNIDPEFLGVFNKTFMKSANKTKNKDIKKEYDLNRDEAITTSAQVVGEAVAEAIAKGMPIQEALNLLKADQQALYHFDNSTWNEVKFNAIRWAADQADDPSLLNVFYESTFDSVTGKEIPGMGWSTKYGQQIRNYQEGIIKQEEQKENDIKKEERLTKAEQRVITGEHKEEIKVAVGDDGILAGIDGKKRTRIAARSWLTRQRYKEIKNNLLKEQKRDGTAKYTWEEAYVIAKDQAIAEAVSQNWTNSALTEAERDQAEISQSNERQISIMKNTIPGRAEIVKYYKYQQAIKNGNVTEEDLYALPFDPTEEQARALEILGQKLYEMETLRIKKEDLIAELSNKRAAAGGGEADQRIQQAGDDIIDLQAEIDAMTKAPDAEAPKDADEIVAETQTYNNEAEFPNVEAMFVQPDGKASATAKQRMKEDYKKYKLYTERKKSLAAYKRGSNIAVPDGFDSWEELETEQLELQKYFTGLNKRFDKNKKPIKLN